jgi:hypothetical protein
MSGSRVNVRSCIGSGRNWRKTDSYGRIAATDPVFPKVCCEANTGRLTGWFRGAVTGGFCRFRDPAMSCMAGRIGQQALKITRL